MRIERNTPAVHAVDTEGNCAATGREGGLPDGLRAHEHDVEATVVDGADNGSDEGAIVDAEGGGAGEEADGDV